MYMYQYSRLCRYKLSCTCTCRWCSWLFRRPSHTNGGACSCHTFKSHDDYDRVCCRTSMCCRSVIAGLRMLVCCVFVTGAAGGCRRLPLRTVRVRATVAPTHAATRHQRVTEGRRARTGAYTVHSTSRILAIDRSHQIHTCRCIKI